MDKKIRLMIVDDSAVYRSWLMSSLSKNERFEIVGYAVDAFDAQRKIPLLKPDIVTLDIEMPGMSGIDFLKKLLPLHPVPVILVSSLSIKVIDALAAGAVDYVQKPDMGSANEKEIFLTRLSSKLMFASNFHVRIPENAKPAAVRPLLSQEKGRALSSARAAIDNKIIIAIGASTGGTEAILEILTKFPANMPGIVITQHMPEGFTSMYAERLNRQCRLTVKEAQGGERIEPNHVLLAPGGKHMRVVRMGTDYAVQCADGEKVRSEEHTSELQSQQVSGHRPSVDVLFDSVAYTAKENAIGVLLTGMGADGAAGLLRMRKNGAYTIGQDRDSCVVYGMPMEAHKIGAVCVQASLNSIHQVVLNQLTQLAVKSGGTL